MSGPKSTTTPYKVGEMEGVVVAQARSQAYAYLSRAFLYPDTTNAAYLRENAAQVARIMQALGVEPPLGSWEPPLGDNLEEAYLAAFGHTISKECPPYEAEYGQADIFQKSEALADIGGFYRAFGVEPRLLDRLDHLSVELEFMQLLALKEAYALAQGHGEERLALCQQAQARFLGEHLGCWVGGFALRLASKPEAVGYAAVGELVSRFVAWDMGRYGLVPPSLLDLSVGEGPSALPQGGLGAACDSCPGPAAMGGVKDE